MKSKRKVPLLGSRISTHKRIGGWNNDFKVICIEGIVEIVNDNFHACLELKCVFENRGLSSVLGDEEEVEQVDSGSELEARLR